MVTYYLDTSAIVKRYVDEPGSVWLKAQVGGAALRSYDAIHLAAALAVQHSLRVRGLSDLVFLNADDRLLSTAAAEGLAVDNPNLHE